jgi:hypothetical protein
MRAILHLLSIHAQSSIINPKKQQRFVFYAAFGFVCICQYHPTPLMACGLWIEALKENSLRHNMVSRRRPI